MVKQRTPSASQNLGCGILWSSTSTLAFLLIWISYLSLYLSSFRSVIWLLNCVRWHLGNSVMICSTVYLCICRSFYVGDAAGRENDHSDADIKFAQVMLKLSCPLFTSSFPCSNFLLKFDLYFILFFFFSNFFGLCMVILCLQIIFTHLPQFSLALFS